MGRERKFQVYDHKMLDCPLNPDKKVGAWRAEDRSVLLTVDSSVDPSVVNIIGSAMSSVPPMDVNKPFRCPECTGNGCQVVLDRAVTAGDIPQAFQSIKIVPVPIEALPPV
jgi:hypothetical protein